MTQSQPQSTSLSHRPHQLRSVLFIPGHYDTLFGHQGPFGQLDGVLELIDFANSYVLNDVTVLGGSVTAFQSDEISDQLRAESCSSDSLEVVAHSTGRIETRSGDYAYDATYDLSPFEVAVGIPEVSAALMEIHDKWNRQLWAARARGDVAAPAEPWEERHRRELGDQANLLQAQSYILLADAIGATLVPERRYGRAALDNYSELPQNSPHIKIDSFRKRLMERLAETPRPITAGAVNVPSFLTEAVRNAETPKGVFNALRHLRYSRAAERYRDLVRSMTDPTQSAEEQQRAAKELHQSAEAAFSGDGMRSRIPRWLRPTVGLSSLAVRTVFPETGIWPLVAGGLFQAVEQIDAWVRRRNNVFEPYAATLEIDLYPELKRVFPGIQFDAPHLSHFLSERNFGWSTELDLQLFLRHGRRPRR